MVEIHNRNVLHYDLKLANIMFNEIVKDSQLKLIDFGLSISLENEPIVRLTDTQYFPPEVIKAYEENIPIKADKSMDVYMMGYALIQLFFPATDESVYLFDRKENKCKLKTQISNLMQQLTGINNAIFKILVNFTISENLASRMTAKQILEELNKFIN